MRLDAQRIDAVLGEAVAAGVAPGVVAGVTSPDGVLYEAAHGWARTEPAGAMRVDTVVRIASMTKPVTTLAVLMLCEEGKLSLDAPLADYLPGYTQPEVLESIDMATGEYATRPAASAVTVRQLLSHTSGYGYWFLDPPLYRLTSGTPELFVPPFLISDPGTEFAYSVSTDVLGRVVPAVSGLALDAFFAARIFAPLGLHDTGYTLPAERDRLAALHRRRPDGFEELPLERRSHGVRGGGGLYSTVPDYLRLLRLLMNHGELDGVRLLSEGSVAEMMHNQIGELFAERQTTALPERSNDFIFMDGTQKFGLGFMIDTRDRPAGRRAGSVSWAGISNTYFWIDSASGLGAVLCMQTMPFADSVSIDFYRRFEGAVYAARR